MLRLIDRFVSGDRRSATVKSNILGSLAVKGCSILIQLLLVPITLAYVSADIYGIWLTLSSVILWLNFFDIGFTLGLKNKLAEAVAHQDCEKGRQLVSTTYGVMFVIFIPLCLLLELLVPLLPWASFLNVSKAYNTEITHVMHLLVLFFCIQMIVNVITAVVAAFQKVALSSLFPVIGNFFSLIIIYILTKTTPPSLVYLAYAITLMPILVMVVSSFLLFHGKFRQVRPHWTYFNRKYIRELFGLGSKFFLLQLQVVFLYQSTNILIANVATAVDVTIYNVAYKYLSIASMIFIIILGPLWPAFTDAYAKQDFPWMQNVYKRMIKIFGGVTLFQCILVAISSPIYSIWVKDSVVIPFSTTLLVAIYLTLQGWCSLQAYPLNGIGKIKLQTYLAVIGASLQIPLAIGLGHYLGANGVILSLIFINLVYCICYTIQIRKILEKTATGIWAK